jgi:hypothetical protein
LAAERSDRSCFRFAFPDVFFSNPKKPGRKTGNVPPDQMTKAIEAERFVP